MTIKRLMTQIRFWTYLGRGDKRAKYSKEKHIFAEVGDNSWLPATLPLYPKLVKIHNNVCMHRSVVLVTHDRMNNFLSNASDAYKFKNSEMLSPIEIMDNVYIGMNCIILGNVKIGSNVIINAGSVVVTDIPSNSIVSGNPAKVVGKFDLYKKTRVLMDKRTNFEFKRASKESYKEQDFENAWTLFEKKKNKGKNTADNKDD